MENVDWVRLVSAHLRWHSLATGHVGNEKLSKVVNMRHVNVYQYVYFHGVQGDGWYMFNVHQGVSQGSVN